MKIPDGLRTDTGDLLRNLIDPKPFDGYPGNTEAMEELRSCIPDMKKVLLDLTIIEPRFAGIATELFNSLTHLQKLGVGNPNAEKAATTGLVFGIQYGALMTEIARIRGKGKGAGPEWPFIQAAAAKAKEGQMVKEIVDAGLDAYIKETGATVSVEKREYFLKHYRDIVPKTPV